MMEHVQKDDRVECFGQMGTVLDVLQDKQLSVLFDGTADVVKVGDCSWIGGPTVSLLDEVQTLINLLVSMGQDNKRLLSRRVAALMAESKGALSRSDKLQCAAMLLVSAGLAADHVAERDDG